MESNSSNAVHLALALFALYWTRNLNKNNMVLSEYLFGVVAMYQLVAIGYSILFLQ